MSALDDFLQQTDYGAISSREQLTGGSINTVERLRFETGLRVILKQLKPTPANFFQAEASALKALRQAQAPAGSSGHSRCGRIPPARRLGRRIAPQPCIGRTWEKALPSCTAKAIRSLGLRVIIFCGASPQRNPRLNDGFEFFANYRLLSPSKSCT